MKIVTSRPTITRKELEAVLDCLINDELVAGESVRHFETSIAKMIGLKHSLATTSLTAAYHLVFKALEIGESDEVIIPSFFPQAPLSALAMTGGKAVLLDIEKDSIFPAVAAVRERITPKTRAVVTGDLFGFHGDREGPGELGVPVIEDISHSIGTERDELPAGRNGSFAVASFDPAGIITTGNGGMVLTNNSKHYSVMKELRGNGKECLHFDYTMTDFQGSMGITQIAKLPDLLARRREIARLYHESVRITPHATPFLFGDQFAYQSFPVLFNATDERIESYWRKTKIEMTRSIGHPLHRLLGLGGADYPNTERYAKKLYSVPLYPTLSRKDVEKISRAMAGFI